MEGKGQDDEWTDGWMMMYGRREGGRGRKGWNEKDKRGGRMDEGRNGREDDGRKDEDGRRE